MLPILLEELEKIEKEQGMVGTIVGVLLLAVIALFSIGTILLVAKWWISASIWVIEFFIGVKIL